VYALSAASGAKLWNFTTGNVIESSPAVANGVVYVGSSDGNMYALSAATGAKQWNFTTGSQAIASYGPAHRWSDRIAGRPLVRIEGAHR
jgi:outer membrane protein assembly factor BamB